MQRERGLRWYGRRLAAMPPSEVLWRVRDQVMRVAWSGRRVRVENLGPCLASDRDPVPGARLFTAALPDCAQSRVPAEAGAAVLAAADGLMRGEWEVLGIVRTDLAAPDWFLDPVTGRRAPADRHAFRIDYRSEQACGDAKQVWELSRLHHLTLLAAAWFVSRDDAYALRVADQLRSWWRQSAFLSGIHWTSGIEIGIRLISMTWIRRLLDDWPKVTDLFENDELAVRQIRWHQQYLAVFRSRGSSANNHAIAEAAGLLVASCAFAWFPESDRWRREAARRLEEDLVRNAFPSGIGRELATDYQCFIAELGLIAAAEADLAGHPVSDATWRRLCAMVDASAAVLDQRLRAPRQGDGDDGRALLLDAPQAGRWASLLELGAALVGAASWWPSTRPDVRSSLIGALAGRPREVSGRPARRPWQFPDAGTTLLLATGDREPEIWCRCDGGPHGFPGLAAHAHADALSVEVRHGGVDILADPGTYCYFGAHDWRSYFRSTIAHNTVEVDGRCQSASGGPFLWLRHANGRVLDVLDVGDVVEWTAEHDGYRSLGRRVRHRRCVRLDRASRSIDIVDEVGGGCHQVRLALHFGPDVEAELLGQFAILRWPDAATPGAARLQLAPGLHWSLHKGEAEPILGWYSPGFGRRVPAFVLLGQGRSTPQLPIVTRLEFRDRGDPPMPHLSSAVVSQRQSHAPVTDAGR